MAKTLYQATLFSLLALLACSAQAHHGWSGYVVDFTMDARVSKTRFGNPHDQIWVVDAEGNEWNFLLAPPARNRSYGYDETSLIEGQAISIVGQRAARGFEGKIHFIYNEAGENIYTYYYSGGRTSWDREH